MTEPARVDFESAGGVSVAAYRWDPEGEPRAIAQLAHGVGEHAQRYAPLAEALTAEGYAASASAIASGGQLCQHHCPVAHVAAEFPQLCEVETAVIGRLVGTHVQRLATIAHGDGVCTTHIPGPRHPGTTPARGVGDHTRAGNRSNPARPVPDERAAHRLRAGARTAPSTSSTPTNDRERTPA